MMIHPPWIGWSILLGLVPSGLRSLSILRTRSYVKDLVFSWSTRPGRKGFPCQDRRPRDCLSYHLDVKNLWPKKRVFPTTHSIHAWYICLHENHEKINHANGSVNIPFVPPSWEHFRGWKNQDRFLHKAGEAPSWNEPETPQEEGLMFQPLIFRGELLVSRRVLEKMIWIELLMEILRQLIWTMFGSGLLPSSLCH